MTSYFWLIGACNFSRVPKNQYLNGGASEQSLRKYHRQRNRGAEGATPQISKYMLSPPPRFSCKKLIYFSYIGIILTYMYLVSLAQPA